VALFVRLQIYGKIGKFGNCAAAPSESIRCIMGFVSVTTAARRLQLPPRTLRYMCQRGTFPAQRVGDKGNWRIPMSALPAKDVGDRIDKPAANSP
jgi:hypothetical protein